MIKTAQVAWSRLLRLHGHRRPGSERIVTPAVHGERRVAALTPRTCAAPATRRSDQIDGSNFNKLEVAWRFKTDMLGPRPEYKLEGTPLTINGVLYTTGGTRRSVIALDGKTGELMWAHSLREGRRAGIAPRQLSGARRVVLDRRPRRRSRHLRHHRLPAGRAQREDRRDDQRRSARTASSI